MKLLNLDFTRIAHDTFRIAGSRVAYTDPFKVAKQDKAYREVLATLTDVQKAKVIELLDHCIRGAVFSTLVTLDQFPHGEAEVFVWDGVCGEGKRRFQIAPNHLDLHDDFMAAFQASKPA